MGAIRKIHKLTGDNRAVGVLLLACTFISLVVTNSPWGAAWVHGWHFSAPSAQGHVWTIGFLHLPSAVEDWLNDAGMAIFFFMAGMEIKRELTGGHLSAFRQAILPAAAAVGGMLLPAGLFLLITTGTAYSHGWGIPMATDIAFSLGVAAILGSRMPASLKIFLTALAIIDDLGAILTIAIFYSHGLAVYYLLGGAGIWLLLLALTYFKVPFGWFQVLLGIVLWYCIFNSGVHATVAGVLFAFTVPIKDIKKWEHRVHFPVNFIIIPLFALANTAILLPADPLPLFRTPLSLGILSGLLIGKTLGITGAVLILVKSGVSSLPGGSNWRQVIGTGLLAGIGFTMSIFITLLAYNEPEYQDVAKIAVLVASLLAMGGAMAWFRWVCDKPKISAI